MTSLAKIAELRCEAMDHAATVRRARTAIRLAQMGMRDLILLTPELASPQLLAYAGTMNALCEARLMELMQA